MKKIIQYGVGILLCLVLMRDAHAQRRPSAGILPYYIDKSGQAYFLIGQEPDGSWADFGGRADKSDLNPKETAMREFTEETRCVFGMYDYKQNRRLRKRILHYPECTQASYRYIKQRMSQGLRHPRGYYVMYIARVEHIPAEVFNRAAKIPHYEKKKYVWVNADAFINTVALSTNRQNTYFEGKKIRPPFCDMVKAHQSVLRRMIHIRRQSALLSTRIDHTTHVVG